MRDLALALLAAASGCGFSLTTEEGVGGDVAPAIDAPPDAPPDVRILTYQVVETMVVDTANPQPMFSALTLQAGVVYRLRVSGTINTVIDAHQGDADWYDFTSPKDNGCCEDIGLGIDDLVVNDLATQPDWGPYDPTHIYEVPWTGSGAPISALFQDTYHANNVGSLTLEILALQ